jgi:hypothetical protein
MTLTERDVMVKAREKYMRQPVNYGPERGGDHLVDIVEQDAFEAGFEAALKWMRSSPTT